ncbi:MAG: Asp-tRNA(Asn)/Glu-tRNA(Gln) amidotransferase subunit GatB [Actinobacteria bacterium]|nr:Asp-tRNA(Asn)/Glu-tRNA(Gln) amidotransferase subunit GatB [Actinomycetota bacterium]
MQYESVIGLEIHVELLTESKMFCGCAVSFGEESNTLVCPVCLGHPGSLPVINQKAIEYTIRIGHALNCDIAEFTQFHRKNYFYPDMPKNYQISQYDLPLCLNGFVDLEIEGYTRRVGITRVHIEEDTGKLVHMGESGRIHGADYSLVDFNRAGTPLAEIVTEPDIRSPEEARVFLQKLKSILEHLEVSDCNMEEGSLRCDANVSIRKIGTMEFGVKAELKNMNSFKFLAKGLECEIKRQEEILEDGGTVIQETRHYDSVHNITSSLRSKEEAHDYRYFPEPDLVPLEPDSGWVENIRLNLPELPDARLNRFMDKYNLSRYDAAILTSSKSVGDFFEECAKDYQNTKTVANWIMGDFTAKLNSANLEIDECAVTPKHLIDLLKLIDNGTISGKIAKSIFDEVFETGKLPRVIVEEKGLTQISNEEEIIKIIDMVLEENASIVEDIRQGKDKAFGFLVGQVMKLTKGRANPALVNQILRDKLK